MYWGLAALVYLGAFSQLAELPRSDPDRYYHLALSREFAQQGLVREFPQVEDLGWAKYFPEKEVLFHWVTGATDRLGGERLTLLWVPALALSLFALFIFFAREASVLPSAWIVGVLWPVLTPEFLKKLIAFRPYLLALVLAVAMLVALDRRRMRTVALFAALFALSYHALYLPVLVLAVFALMNRHDPLLRRCVVAGGIGLGVGVLVNPYFPAPLVNGWQNLLIALRHDPAIQTASTTHLGVEVAPLPWGNWLSSYAIYLVSLPAMFWRVRSSRARTLGVVAVSFWIFSRFTQRSIEYAIPMTVLFLIAGVGELQADLRKRAMVLFAALALIQASLGGFAFIRAGWPSPPHVASYFAAIDALPAESQGAKVFNGEWDLSPFVLYRRPDLRVVDALSWTYLRDYSPEKFRFKQDLVEGKLREPTRVLKEVFQARYVMTRSPPLVQQLREEGAQLLFGNSWVVMLRLKD